MKVLRSLNQSLISRQSQDANGSKFYNEDGDLCIHMDGTGFISKDLSLPTLMFKGMESSTLGVWAAHAEGRAYFHDVGVPECVLNSNLVPKKYCNDDGKPTEMYSFNLKSSPFEIAAICSLNSRHLAMMPHPKCCFFMWQFPSYPKQWNLDKKGPTPWLQMFQNV